MKYFCVVVIIFCFGFYGYANKIKYVKQKEFLIFIRNFLEYLYLNISIYKNNLTEIINSYKIQQINKNAKFDDFFQNNDNFSKFNEKIINKYIYDSLSLTILKELFLDLGKANKEIECEKIKNVVKFLEKEIEETEVDVKVKGDFSFKILLCLGLLISIIIW